MKAFATAVGAVGFGQLVTRSTHASPITKSQSHSIIYQGIRCPALVGGVAALLMLLGSVMAARGAVLGPSAADQVTPVNLLQTFGNVPMSFEVNQGQAAAEVKFMARGRGYAVYLTSTEAILALRARGGNQSEDGPVRPARRQNSTTQPNRLAQSEIRLKLVGANPDSRIEGCERLPGTVSYFLGDDPQQWHSGIATYARIKYEEVYPGIDLIYYGNQRQLEYDFVVRPGSDPACIRLAFEGAARLEVAANGELVVHLKDGAVRWHKPVVYQEANHTRHNVPAEYVLTGGNQIGFSVGPYDSSRPLVIDPILVYSTYLGGSDFDSAKGIAVDAQGNAHVVGDTFSTNFPTFSAYRATRVGSNDVFVTKFNAAGTAILFSTYLGGSGDDFGRGIAVDTNGNVYVTGRTESANFPTRNASQSSHAGFGDAFVSKLGPFGTNLLYSTYFGGSDSEWAHGIAVDGGQNAYIAGETYSGPNFPKKSPFQNNAGGFLDGFVAKFNTTLSGSASLIYASWLGGSGDDRATAIAADSSGSVYVTGEVFSFDFATASFPTQNPLQPTYAGGGSDAFVTKINAAGSAMVFSTFLGGEAEDSGFGITVDSGNNVYLTGQTSSTNFPATSGAAQPVIGGGGIFFTADAFVTKLNSAGSSVLYSTFLGGSLQENLIPPVGGVAVDERGYIYVTGQTFSDDFPVTPGAVDSTNDFPFADVFVAKLNPAVVGPASLIFATFLGGAGNESGNGIGVDTNGNFYVAGETTSTTNFPLTSGVFQSSFGGVADAFVAKFASPADMSVAKLVSTNSVIIGSNLTYTLLVNNNGRSPFSGVVLTDALPANLQYVSATTTRGSFTQTGQVVVCNFGVMTNDAAATVTITAKTITPGMITNTGQLTVIESEPNTNNNVSAVATLIRGVADVTLAMSGAPNPVFASSNLTYTIGVTNKGPWSATSLVVTDTLPANVIVVSADSTQGSCATNVPGIVTCDLGTLTNGGGAAITLVVRPMTGTSLTNIATVTTVELDMVLANNTATTVTTVIPLADLGLSGTASPNPVFASSNLTYLISVTNRGPSTGTGVQLTNALPAGVTLVSNQVSQGTCTQAGSIVTCNLGSLTNGATAIATLVVKPFLDGAIALTASVGSSVTDPVPGNNNTTVVATVNPLADLSLSQTVSPNPVTALSNVTYTLRVTNRGPSTATGVVLTDTLPGGLMLLEVQPSQGTWMQSGSAVTCNLGSLNSNATATVTIIARTMFEGTVTNIATVNSAVSDPNSANNTASAVTTILENPAGPLLRIARVGTNVLLHWPTNAVGFSLQSSTGLAPTNQWTAVTNVPVIVSGRFYVTNTITGSARHYRLFKQVAAGPSLSAALVEESIVVSWPTSVIDFTLQSTTNLPPTNWTTVTNAPAISGSRYVVTNSTAGNRRFYRLRK